MNPQEKIYKRIIKPGRSFISYQALRNLGIKTSVLKEILPRYNRRAETDRENPNNLLIMYIEVKRPTGLLPCMVDASEIIMCHHAGECYLANKCAAGKQLQKHKEVLFSGKEDIFKRLRDSSLGRMQQ